VSYSFCNTSSTSSFSPVQKKRNYHSVHTTRARTNNVPKLRRFCWRMPCWHARKTTTNQGRIFPGTMGSAVGGSEATAIVAACKISCNNWLSIQHLERRDDRRIALAAAQLPPAVDLTNKNKRGGQVVGGGVASEQQWHWWSYTWHSTAALYISTIKFKQLTGSNEHEDMFRYVWLRPNEGSV
jgi:hypothetical protein